jgi:ankyrin repeat protein
MSKNLEQQRKRAKDLRREHASGSVAAAERVERHLPRARGRSVADVLATRLSLSEAQLVIAREAGFESWPRLKHALAVPADDVEAVLEAALAGEPVHGVAPTPIHAAAALADVDRVLELVADPALVDLRGGKRDWTPLLYACCARHGHRDPHVVAGRIRIARRLLELGADVNAVGRELGFGSEHVDGFDVETWCPLAGAAGRVGSADLMRVLLDAGASAEHAPALLKHAVYSGDLRVLETALAAEPPWWQVIWALVACADLDRPVQARMLVPHAESPRSLESSIIRAIREERDVGLIAILLGEFEPSEQRRAVEDHAYRAARRYGHAAAAARLRERGASDAVLTAADRVIAGDSTDAVALDDDDHRMLSWAIAKRHLDRVPRLLAAGCDPNVHDHDGLLPLHHAVRVRSIETIDRLLAAGASIDAASFDNETPLAIADPDIASHLRAAGASEVADRDDAAQIFERAADAVAAGDLSTLRELLDDDPELVHARSPRTHRATLLHYCGANGTESPRQRTPPNAAAVAELLLARGADPNATCKLYGGGTTTLGLMLTSCHPRAAGVDGDLVRVLANYGARIDAGAMDTAVQYASPRAVQALVDAGLPMTLLVAAALDRVDVIEQQLAAGIDVNTRFADGYTALHAAAGMGHRAAVTTLLAHGGDRGLLDTRWGGTPAAKARYFEHPDLVDLL